MRPLFYVCARAYAAAATAEDGVSAAASGATTDEPPLMTFGAKLAE